MYYLKIKGNSLKARVFIDSYVKNCDSKTLETAWRLGYKIIICEDPHSVSQLRSSSGVPRVIKKTLLSVKDQSELKKHLKDVDYNRTFVTIHPLSIDVARWCTHDSRVDSILMTHENLHVFDKRQLGVMKYYSKPLEITIKDLLERVDLRELVYRRLKLYVSRRLPFILSSRAERWSDLYSPLALLKIMSTQYDIPDEITMLALSNIPEMIISRKKVDST